MDYPSDVSSRLSAMGFVSPIDFRAEDDGTAVKVAWLSAQPMPSEAEINAFDMSPQAVAAREDAKEPLLADLKAQAQAAIAANVTYLAKPAPTIVELTAQVRRLTQQNNRLIPALARLVVRTWR